MKPRTLTLTAAVVATLTLSACNSGGNEPDPVTGTDTTVTIEVVSAPWSGWSKEQPKSSTKEVSVAEGDTFRVDGMGDDIVFTVTDIDGDAVELESSDELAPRGDEGGADMNDLESEFELEGGGTLVLTTPTLDAGVTYTMTLA